MLALTALSVQMIVVNQQNKATQPEELLHRKAIKGYLAHRTKAIEKQVAAFKKLYAAKQADRLAELSGALIKSSRGKEPYAYLYRARAAELQKDYPAALYNYRKAVEGYPYFADRRSDEKKGIEMKHMVKIVLGLVRRNYFAKMPHRGKMMKNLYYLQRRLAGGCE